jgi:polyhydroxyalkanoate synthesis regulator phasin
MKHAQASADRAQSQLFESSSQAESRISALQSENAMLAEHSSRSDSRIAELERQVEDLKMAATTVSICLSRC